MSIVDWSGFERPRYCDRPFPPYRYTPGLHPHPTAHPQGHSYHPPGLPSHPPPRISAASWGTCAEYLYGCDLYNHGYWWEAHEAWEDVWRGLEPGQLERSFLQGLIQTAACHLQWLLGRWAGVQRLLVSSEAHFAALGEHTWFFGLDLPGFRRTTGAYYQDRIGPGRRPHAPPGFPFIELRGDIAG